ncbi:MAG: EboA domain-containing protein [Pseudomonadota bacterium]|nr:EboA domain-containing protein [Pseudomonadota bacterium]
MTIPSMLVSLLCSRLDPGARDWLRATLEETTAPFDGRTFRAEWARMGRRLGSSPVIPMPEEAAQLQAVGLWPFVGWGVDECGRAALLLQALRVAEPDTHGALVDSLYLRGTIRERQALLRSLAYLPKADRFNEVAIQACRTHVASVFEALAIGNPYPFRYLPRAEFDQMVLKALSFRVSPERIVGLTERLSTDLTRPRATSGPRWGSEVTRVALRAL